MKILKTVFSRTGIIVILALLEVGWVFGLFEWFGAHLGWIEGVLRLFAVVIVLTIIKNSQHLSSDMMWIILILLFPVPGTAVYLLVGADLFSSRTFRSLVKEEKNSQKYYDSNPEVLKEMEQKAPQYSGQFRYIAQNQKYPFYENTGFSYYGLGDTGYPVMLEELKKAEKFIFLEYFIIEEGQMWNGILDILEKKAEEGLDVRVMYDDMGSLGTLPYSYAKKMEEKGIQCIPFNRINPIINIILNHRDHRKILVIDGKTAFSGGINLADEYINVKVIHGHWKDNCIRITGEAVWSYTVMFLTGWNALRPTDSDFRVFRHEPLPGKKDGWIAPYAETPLDHELTGQYVYINILNQANDYCYIYSPYLIIDTEMISALILAAKRGVDVRIMTPGVPDKKIVWDVTRSYYHQLIEGGVKIYEYTPGFVHAKVFVCDDRIATVGTLNLDYRSLYLHFENGTYLFDSSQIQVIRKDYEDSIAVSHLISDSESKPGILKEFLLSVVRLFAPLM